MNDLIFSVKGESTSPAKFIAKTRQFQLIIDEPKGLGGTDENANPVNVGLNGIYRVHLYFRITLIPIGKSYTLCRELSISSSSVLLYSSRHFMIPLSSIVPIVS